MTASSNSTPAAAGDDPIRADVERALRQAVDVALALPLAAAGQTRRCVTARAARLGERLVAPVRLVRSLVDAVAGNAAATSTPPAAAAPAPADDLDLDVDIDVDIDVDESVEPAAGQAGDAADLPIEEYESLAASHVVARLPQLDAEELHRVRDFELANRGRRTVLGKIEQLLAP